MIWALIALAITAVVVLILIGWGMISAAGGWDRARQALYDELMGGADEEDQDGHR